MKSNELDLTLVYDGEDIRAVGTIDTGEPPTGPSYDCGGTPGFPAHVDDVKFFAADGSEIEDPDGKILAAIEDEIIEKASEQFADDDASAQEDKADYSRDQELDR